MALTDNTISHLKEEAAGWTYYCQKEISTWFTNMYDCELTREGRPTKIRGHKLNCSTAIFSTLKCVNVILWIYSCGHLLLHHQHLNVNQKHPLPIYVRGGRTLLTAMSTSSYAVQSEIKKDHFRLEVVWEYVLWPWCKTQTVLISTRVKKKHLTSQSCINNMPLFYCPPVPATAYVLLLRCLTSPSSSCAHVYVQYGIISNVCARYLSVFAYCVLLVVGK